jgi:hypothetical protein
MDNDPSLQERLKHCNQFVVRGFCIQYAETGYNLDYIPQTAECSFCLISALNVCCHVPYYLDDRVLLARQTRYNYMCLREVVGKGFDELR